MGSKQQLLSSTLFCSDPCLLSQLHFVYGRKAVIGVGTCHYAALTFFDHRPYVTFRFSSTQSKTVTQTFFECKNSLYLSVFFP